MFGSTLSLARWLGPWADSTKAPQVLVREEDADGVRIRIYGRHGHPYLIAPGLHFAGPDDPRLDRFCRILANAGHLVIAPFIPDYLALMPNARAIADFRRVFAARARWKSERPTVFSISFGSLLAFALAADHASDLDGLEIFGGYADFHATMEFCLTGTVGSGRNATRDPLNQSIVLMNLLDHLDPPCADSVAVAAAWRRYVMRVWGRPEMKARERFTAIADELAPDVADNVRELFHIGVGTQPGAVELAMPALARFDARALDPSPYLPRVRGRVDLVHGTNDDVVPFEQSHALARQLTHADVRVHITGMYGHTGSQTPRLSVAAKEMITMLRVLRVLAR
jgi:pimeloyl-ACP methyl ester carboxylesterase